MKIYNGEGMILGRLAAIAAKEALLGEEVKVVNCEKVIISGKKVNTFDREQIRHDRKGYPLKSAKRPKLSDRYVRRAIRGMLPWKFPRGKEAFKRIMCYKGLPAEFSSQEIITLQDSSVSKLPNLKYTTIEEVCKHLNGKA